MYYDNGCIFSKALTVFEHLKLDCTVVEPGHLDWPGSCQTASAQQKEKEAHQFYTTLFLISFLHLSYLTCTYIFIKKIVLNQNFNQTKEVTNNLCQQLTSY